MKFNEMTYKRPDIDEVREQSGKIISGIKGARSFNDADAHFSEFQEYISDVYTQLSLCYVRHTIDTKDIFYDKENDYCDEIMPQVAELVNNAGEAVYSSKFRANFEAKYGMILFKNIEMLKKSFSPEIIPDMQEENKLISEYDKLIASAQIEFEGETYTLSQLSPKKQVVNDEKRFEAWKAEGDFYSQNGPKLDEIYDSMVKVRHNMAKTLGFSNFVEVGYARMQRNCYTVEDVEKFRSAVRRYVVPVAEEIYKAQAKRTGSYFPLTYPDMNLMFRTGNPKPQGSPDEILAHAKKFYHELSPETSEFIDFMFENELFDVLSRKGKAGGGYCTGFETYKSPFIFANFNGTQHDVEVMTHEAGHAFAGYTSFKNNLPYMLASPSADACEVHSMSMEFFAWPWEQGFFGKDTDKFYYSHLAGAITFIPYGTMVDHFQHVMYENPKMRPRERHQVWRDMTSIYMPWLSLSRELPFYGEGKAWQRQAHIYDNPFYYIDYCLAQTVALEFWTVMRRDKEEAWKKYMKFTECGGTKTLTELIEYAGLETPFGDAALRDVAAASMDYLSDPDKRRLQ